MNNYLSNNKNSPDMPKSSTAIKNSSTQLNADEQSIVCPESQTVPNGFPTAVTFWITGFAFASLMALTFQKLILPQLPSLHAGNGLLNNDAVVFHNLAVKAAVNITTYGWSHWTLFPGAAGNVGLLSAVYSVMGPDPVYFIPFNAAAHVSGALLIYLMGQRLYPGKVGALGGITAGIMFLIFPSALQWYGQNHKDAFSIAGILLMLYAWLSIFGQNVLKYRVAPLFLIFCGAVLLATVRPYYPLLVFVSFGVSWCLLFLISIISRTIRIDRISFLLALGSLLIVLAVYAVFSASRPTLGAYDEANISQFSQELKRHSWNNSRFLPASIDHTLERVATIRAHFILFNKSVKAGSSIDEDVVHDNAASLIAYLPRALFVGLFTPFPSTWNEKVSPQRLVGAVETLVWYVITSGIIILFIKRPSRQLIAGLTFVFCLLAILSYVHPNVGTLYRQRFGIWFFVLLCGAIGWAQLILSVLKFKGSSASNECDKVEVTPYNTGKLETVAASGAIVMIITFCCYIGFMARDLILINMYGINVRTDSFFSATMIPMFFVTFLTLPMPDALTAPFLKSFSAHGSSRSLFPERGILFYLSSILGVVTLIIIIFAEKLLPLIISGDQTSFSEGILLLRLFAPVVFLSAWTVTGNTVLNALHCSSQAAIAQMIVPILAISSILAAPFEDGLKAAALGMVCGTLLNAIIVYFLVKRLDLKLWPQKVSPFRLQEILVSYKWLVIAAFFTATITPVNYYFASSLEQGTVAAWAFASKIVQLITGLSGIGITAVVLPHLSRWVTRGNIRVIRNDILFFLIAGTWIGIIIAISVFIFSEPLVFSFLGSGQVSDEQVKKLSDIIKIGCIQLPIVISNTIVIKMAAISGRSVKILSAAACMIIICIVGNFLFVPHLGVLGIALSSVTAVGVSTALLVFWERSTCMLSIYEVCTLIISWILLSAIGVVFHFRGSYAALAIFAGLVILFCMHWHIWASRNLNTILPSNTSN